MWIKLVAEASSDQMHKGGRDQDRTVFPPGDKGQREELVWKCPLKSRGRERLQGHTQSLKHSPAVLCPPVPAPELPEEGHTHLQEGMAPRNQQMELEPGKSLRTRASLSSAWVEPHSGQSFCSWNKTIGNLLWLSWRNRSGRALAGNTQPEIPIQTRFRQITDSYSFVPHLEQGATTQLCWILVGSGNFQGWEGNLWPKRLSCLLKTSKRLEPGQALRRIQTLFPRVFINREKRETQTCKCQ